MQETLNNRTSRENERAEPRDVQIRVAFDDFSPSRFLESVPQWNQLCELVRQQNRSVYLVGGAVRDLLLGIQPSDLDFTGISVDEDLVRIFADRIGAPWFRLQQRMVFYRVVHRAPAGKTFTFDFTELRGANLSADLRRRDFTINAMALDVLHPDAGLIDPLGGRKDLCRGILRWADQDAIDEDPLRLLRIYRFAAQFGLRPDDSLRSAMNPEAGERLYRVSGERIRDELFQILKQAGAASVIRWMSEDGVLERLFPVIRTMQGVEQNEYHHKDVWEHSLLALDRLEYYMERPGPVPEEYRSRLREALERELVPGRPTGSWLKLATLFHDVGKPETRFVDSRGRVRFFRHEVAGLPRTEEALARLHPARREMDWVRNVIRNHMRIGQILAAPVVHPRTLNRFILKAGFDFWAWLLLFLADYAATLGSRSAQGDLCPLQPRLTELMQAHTHHSEQSKRRPPLITGHDLKTTFGLPPGPVYGTILRQVELGRLEGRIHDRDQALDEVRTLLKERKLKSAP